MRSLNKNCNLDVFSSCIYYFAFAFVSIDCFDKPEIMRLSVCNKDDGKLILSKLDIFILLQG